MYQCDLPYSRSKSKMRHSDWCGELIAPKNGRIRFVGITARVALVLECEVAFSEGASGSGLQIALEARGDAFVWEFQ